MIKGQEIRELVLAVSWANNTGHVGSSLSVCEVVAACLNSMGDADSFVLSKGHAALAYYAALHLQGRITKEDLFSYCKPGSKFGVHPGAGCPGVLVPTGSLGMGLAFACGIAIAEPWNKVFCLCSDAEMDEGSTWEAIMLASRKKLKNLVMVLDANGSQALGPSPSLYEAAFSDKLLKFGWECWVVGGHEQARLEGAITNAIQDEADRPRFITAHTVIGKGVPKMEGDYQSHYLPLSHRRWNP